MQVHIQPNLHDIQLALSNKYLSLDPINQFQCMRLQYQIMQTIKQLIQKKKYLPNDHIIYPNNIFYTGSRNLQDTSNSSDLGMFGQAHLLLSSYPDDGCTKNKFTQQYQQSAITSSLKQVQRNCSQQTYDLVRQYLANNKIRQLQNIQKMNMRLIQQRDQLASQILILRLQKANMQKQLQHYKKLVNGIQQQKKSIKKRIDYILKKQNQVFKLQSSFTFKQKIYLELKKRYQRLVNTYLSNQIKLNINYQKLYHLWNNICQKVQSIQCQGNCWRKDTMRKVKQQLLQQRKIIQQQAAYLQKQYQVMIVVSENFKKIFHQPQKISFSNDKLHTQSNQDSGSKCQPSATQATRSIKSNNKTDKNQ